MAANFGWDSDTTRSNVPLVMYLDCFCYRLQRLSSTPFDTAEIPKDPDVFYVFEMVLGSVKKSYERRVSKIQPGFLITDQDNAIGLAQGHCPMLDPTLRPLFDISTSAYAGSFEVNEFGSPGSSITTASNVPIYHDLWATMTCNWAEEV
jgi:hypothetical protein